MPFDTLKIATDLEGAGFPMDQARALARVIGDSREIDLSSLATKSDLAATEAALRREIGDVRHEIADSKADVLKWLFGALTAQGALILALLRFVA